MGNITTTYLVNRTQEFLREIAVFAPTATLYLVGSYASGTATLTSDIDLLIYVDKNIQFALVKRFNSLLKSKYPEIHYRLDCKILARQDFSHHLSNHFRMLYSMIASGKHIAGPQISIQLSSTSLRDSLLKLEDQLTEVRQLISYQRNFDFACFSLFSIGKSLYHLDILINPVKKSSESFKKLFGKHFYQLAKVYERNARKGVQTDLIQRFTNRKQKSGNFNILNQAYNAVYSYTHQVKEKFYVWYDSLEDH